jgi:hypothetical protein
LDIQLEVGMEKQAVTVTDTSKVDVSPVNSVGAIVLKGEDLKAFSDNPDDLQNELLALAGPAAGPNGGGIYIDGFTGGHLPPQGIHPRNPHQPKPLFRRIRQGGFWPHRDLHQAWNR